ncbi:hypothetical protein C8A00DRAFT_35008 [Chaetomidium leptoderma]|uniref:Uncharacterized protein n=1 Tax=Chaetomidium leptoderma TaxID=669021 RepID=A0AAN6VIR8_9PEZI|nr:hypothetical protein C8A00DRAFT_35008 [Chaetomidium leptoderma]
MADDLINFGGKDLAKLYNETGSRDAVFEYLDGVIRDYKTLDPQISDTTKEELQSIRDQIELLSLPEGTEYINKSKNPSQHIRRQVFEPRTWNDKKKRDPKTMSKFTVLAEDPKHYWSLYSEGTRPYWNQYDLLGLFFSKMGPAPGGGSVANQRNFYLPLTAVCAKFCLWLGGVLIPKMTGDDPKKKRKGAGVGAPPACFQCTWNQDTGRFFLGASLAGFVDNTAEVGIWEDRLRETRYRLLDSFYNFPGKWGAYEEKRSPANVYENKKTLFGNCGETYPFLEMIGPHIADIDVRVETHGLALGNQFGGVAEYQTEAFSSYLIPPCLNCQQLLRYAGVYNVAKFVTDSTMETPFFPLAIPLENEKEGENSGSD